MTEQTSKPRVFFLLDHGTQEADVLAVVGAMTGKGDVEVEGLFVEDTDLMAAAARPGFVEVTVSTSAVTSLSQEHVQQAVLREAKSKQELFERTARMNDIRHRFQIRKGRTLETLAGVAERNDLIIVGRSLRAGIRVRSASQYESVVDTHGDVLFVNEPWATGTSVVVVLSQDMDWRQILDRAVAIADDQGLTPHVVASSDFDASSLPGSVHLVQVADFSADALLEVCGILDARLLILPNIEDTNWKEVFASLLNDLSCSLLRVRS